MKSDFYLVYIEYDWNNYVLVCWKDLKLFSYCLWDRFYYFDIDNRVNVFMLFMKFCV